MYRENVQEELDQLRSKIISEGYVVVIAIAIPIYLISLMYHKANTLFGVMPSLIIMGMLFALLVIFVLRKKISYMIRAVTIVIGAILLGVYLIVGQGLIGMGTLYIFFGITLLAVHTTPRIVNTMYYITLVTIVIMGIVFVGGYSVRNFELLSVTDDKQYWTFTIISYAVLAALILRNIIGLNIATTKSIGEVIEKNSALDEARIALKKNYEALFDKTKQIRELAYFDTLTGLPNKTSFVNKVTGLITSNRNNKFSVIYVDIDNQKVINKRIGPAMGDKIIKQLAKQMQFLLPEDAIVSRVDGDAFALITPYCQEDKLDGIVEQIGIMCDMVVAKLELRVNLSCSIGVAIYPEHGTSCEQLLQNGEIALVFAKDTMQSRFFVYNDSINQAIDERELMIEQLRIAVDEQEIFLRYQPKYEATSGELVSFEALARWESNTYGFVSPDVFIPILEEANLIIPFGYLVLKEALTQLKNWHEMGYDHLTIAVNVSPLQFADEHFFEDTISVLEELSIEPCYLELEITENVFIDDFESVKEKLQGFYDYGVLIGLDDFGTGYSSLNYLRDLPIHILKIDKTFVDVINDANQDEIVLRTIISLAHNLGLSVVAEGIENEEQKSFLVENGCDCLQGYLLGRPMLPYEVKLESSLHCSRGFGKIK